MPSQLPNTSPFHKPFKAGFVRQYTIVHEITLKPALGVLLCFYLTPLILSYDVLL